MLVSGVFPWTIVFRFKTTNKHLLSLNWQVLSVDSEVPSTASIPPFAHKPFLQSVSKPLNAVSARSLVWFLLPILQLSKKSSGLALRLSVLQSIYTLRMYTNTASSIEAEQRLCSNWGTYPLYTALVIGLTRERFIALGLPSWTHLRTRYWGVFIQQGLKDLLRALGLWCCESWGIGENEKVKHDSTTQRFFL